MIRGMYDGWGYSPLTQITTKNASRLQPVWVLATGVNNGHEATPIVNDGIMFVATPGSQVIAADVRTGTILWSYKRTLPNGVIILHPN
jgi:alcohol dehydrogenase (cytochrome c)